MKQFFVLILLTLGLSSCATVDSTTTPGASLSGIKTIYVEKLASEDRGIDALIVTRLKQYGYRVTTGPTMAKPAGVDAVVRYFDKWQWDMTMYLLQLDVKVLDGRSGGIIATGKSYRPSLQRKDEEFMVAEVIDSIFRASAPNQ